LITIKKEPYQENFIITYMDAYEIINEFEAASSQVTVSLDEEKEVLAHQSDFNTTTMTRL